MWDLTCPQLNEFQFIKVSDETFCQEFRILRNAYKDDKAVLHCRIERIGEEWKPPTFIYKNGRRYQNPEFDKFFDPNLSSEYGCTKPDYDRNSMSVFRGYTLELEVEERTDGENYWRTVHDCVVTVDEDRGADGEGIGLKDSELFNPGGKNLIYERIYMRSPKNAVCGDIKKPDGSDACAFELALHFWALLGLLIFMITKTAIKHFRDDPCQVCNKPLLVARNRCFWCWFYRSAKPAPRVWAEMVKHDRIKRGRITDLHEHNEEDIFHKIEHLVDAGVTQVLFGATPAQEEYENNSFLLDGYHPQHKKTKAERKADLRLEWEKEEEVKAEKKRRKAEKKARKQLKMEASSSSDVPPSLEDEESGNVKFADAPRKVGFGAPVEHSDAVKEKRFRPSLKATPERSALKSGLKKSIIATKAKFADDLVEESPSGASKRIGFSPVPQQDDSGSSSGSGSGSGSDDDSGSDFEMDFATIDAIAEKAAGNAAAKLGYVEEVKPEEPPKNEKSAKKDKKASFREDQADMRVEDVDDKDVTSSSSKAAAAAPPTKKRQPSRWTKIAVKMESDTIVTYMHKLEQEPKNFQVLQRIGFMAKKEADHEISEDPLFAFHLYRSAAMALQKSVEVRGLNDTIKDPEFPWKDLGESHLRAWLLTGVKGDRHHLEMASQAFSHATKQLVNASDPECLVKYASVQQFLGNYSSAGHILGEILTSFPSYPRSGQVALQASIILKSLHNYKQAAAYLETVLKMGPPAPYTVMDLMFIMARIYDEWSKEDDSKEQTAHKAFMKVYMSLVNEKTIDKEVHFEDWMHDPITWCGLAEKCCAAGHYILAADLFHEASMRYEDTEDEGEPLAALWFEMAKCYCRSGRMTTAKQCLESALKIDPRSKKMVAVWTEWEDPSDLLTSQLALPSGKFAKKLSELMPAR
jgi:tetratricopeptide (TPR) repeat protein